jgi:hypothetical protein
MIQNIKDEGIVKLDEKHKNIKGDSKNTNARMISSNILERVLFTSFNNTYAY